MGRLKKHRKITTSMIMKFGLNTTLAPDFLKSFKSCTWIEHRSLCTAALSVCYIVFDYLSGFGIKYI